MQLDHSYGLAELLEAHVAASKDDRPDFKKYQADLRDALGRAMGVSLDPVQAPRGFAQSLFVKGRVV